MTKLADCPTPSRRAYQFFEFRWFSMRMPQARAATISGSRLWISASPFSRRTSSDSIPPHWFRQRWPVFSLTSKACSTAARSGPAYNITSASRSVLTICPGVTLFRRFDIGMPGAPSGLLSLSYHLVQSMGSRPEFQSLKRHIAKKAITTQVSRAHGLQTAGDYEPGI